MLEISNEKLVQRFVGNMDHVEKWLTKNRSGCSYKEGIISEGEYEYWEMAWLFNFKNTIPSNWDRWYNVHKSVTEHQLNQAEMDKEILEATITHPHWQVVMDTALSQRLDPEQLAKVIVHPGMGSFYNWKHGEVIKHQKKLHFENRFTRAINWITGRKNYSDQALELVASKGLDNIDFLQRTDLPVIASELPNSL